MKPRGWSPFVVGLIVCAALVAGCTPPQAQTKPTQAAAATGPITVSGFPQRQLRIMAPANPGGGWDQTSRAVEEVLEAQQIAAQPVEVFNRGGAGGTIGLAELIAQSRG